MLLVVGALVGMCTYPAQSQIVTSFDSSEAGGLASLHVSLELNNTDNYVNHAKWTSIQMSLSGHRSLQQALDALNTPFLPLVVESHLQGPGSFFGRHSLLLQPHSNPIRGEFSTPPAASPAPEFIGRGVLSSVSHGAVTYDRATASWVVTLEDFRQVTDFDTFVEYTNARVGSSSCTTASPSAAGTGVTCARTCNSLSACGGFTLDTAGICHFCTESSLTTAVAGSTAYLKKGPSNLDFTITNLPVPNHCEPTNLHFTLEGEASQGPPVLQIFPNATFPTATACQAAPVWSTNVQFVETPEDTPIDMYHSPYSIQVSDSTPNPVPMVVVAFARNGSLAMNTTGNMTPPGIAIETWQGGFEIKGMEADINTVLASMSYMPDPHFNGNDTITLLADDMDHRGPGPNGVSALNIRVLVVPVAEPVMVTLADSPYLEAGARTETPFRLSMQDPDDLMNTAHVKMTISVSVGHFKLDLGSALVNATMPTDILRSSHTINGSIAELNKVLDSLKYQSDQALTCSGVVEGDLNVTALKTVGQLKTNMSWPLYIVSEGVVDGCGRDTIAWADFTPTSALVGQEVTITFLGYKAYSLPSGGISAALSYSEECWKKNWTHAPVSVLGGNKALAVTLPVTEVGNFTLCYWTRGVVGTSEWGEPNPIPMKNKMMIYANATAGALFGGFTTCQEFVDHQNTVLNAMGVCGCTFSRSQVNVTGLGVVSMPVGYPAHQLTSRNTSLVAKMGCCKRNTPVVQNYPLDAASSWSYCSQM